MKTPDQKELIKEITELFQAHEEPYEVGAWEDFSKQRKKKKIVPLAWIGAAAALLLILSVLPFVFRTDPVHLSVSAGHQPNQKGPSSIMSGPSENKIDQDNQKNGTDQQVAFVNPYTTGHLKKDGRPKFQSSSMPTKEVNEKDTQSVTPVALLSQNLIKSATADAVVANINSNKKIQPQEETGIKHKEETSLKPPVKKQTFEEFLRSEAKSEATANVQTKPASRWDFGVEVSPTMLQSRLNMGAGVSTEYRLSKKFSLSSGISYVALDAGKSVTPPSSGVSSFASDGESNKKLLSVQASIQAIDIPIALTYNVNKNFYTSLGVSYFGVFKEKRGSKYVTELEVNNSLQNIATGKIESFQSVLSENSTEVATDLPLKGNSYLGFFNFSVGHKQEIFKGYKVIVEPFLKVPIGKLSDQDLKLSNGGVKLKFTF